MRVAQPVEAAKPIVQGLQTVAKFLNAVGPDMTRDQWRDYLYKYLRTHDHPGLFITFVGTRQGRASVTLREAKAVRQLIDSDLRYLDFDRKRIPTTEAPFGPLTVRLNEQFKAGSWHCAALGTEKADPGQAVLTRKRQDGTTERWAATFLPFRETQTLKEKFYAILGRALLAGNLTRLKLCRQCGRYFVAVKDRKRDFCEGKTCKDDFHSLQRGRIDYYKDRWQQQRKAAIKKASQLLATGRARKVPDLTLFEQIKEETGLPRREVDKIFEED